VRLGASGQIDPLLFILQKLEKFTYWQDRLNPHPDVSTPVFCAEPPQTESVN
jgi:hypothetical protein